MLRTTIEKNHNIDINYPKLLSLLKKFAVGYTAKKSNVFEPNEIDKFLSEAPDNEFLATKVTFCMFLNINIIFFAFW